MKKLILMMASAAFMCSFAIAGTPPKAVEAAFDKKFPTATKVSWGEENEKEWEAEFTFKGKKISANFLNDGTWTETETEITVAELPAAVRDEVKEKYPAYKITEADKTETAKNGTIYEVDIKDELDKKSLAYKADGTLVIE